MDKLEMVKISLYDYQIEELKELASIKNLDDYTDYLTHIINLHLLDKRLKLNKNI